MKNRIEIKRGDFKIAVTPNLLELVLEMRNKPCSVCRCYHILVETDGDEAVIRCKKCQTIRGALDNGMGAMQ